MELAKGGELFDRLLEAGSLGEREAGWVMGQVCSLLTHPGLDQRWKISLAGSCCSGRPALSWDCAQGPQAWKPPLLWQSFRLGTTEIIPLTILWRPFTALAGGWLWSLWVWRPALSKILSVWDCNLSCPWSDLSDTLFKSSGPLELWCYCLYSAMWIPSLL